MIYSLGNRGVAQLVAYVLWEHGVAGSNPVTSTILKQPDSLSGCFLLFHILSSGKLRVYLLYDKILFFVAYMIRTLPVSINCTDLVSLLENICCQEITIPSDPPLLRPEHPLQ